ncbi:putative serine/arginine repetitive matrix protein 1 [Apostichopus japonicus]|uniref:Putative serine/arginine repetitive matrix protein 1 n=1 Tax=Stichopus japonicus TaxID=307972 RepID=A0A2G8LCL2_STIJA|nr:putative serine/arginine repetitive matrix protein 1 [Apostichopus japonicus]
MSASLRRPLRVQTKKKSMRRKIHEAFRSKVKTEEDERASVSSEDSNSIENEETEKRLTAVRKTKARTSHYCSLEQARRNIQSAKLYEYVVVVSLEFDKTQRRYQPCEIRRFPDEVSDTQNDKLRAIPHFCFPDSFKWAPVDSYNSETFSFVLTSFDGSRFYGYNRRLLPPGEGARLPEVFCVMTPIPCYPLYFQLLDEVERRRKHSMEEVDAFLKIAAQMSLPRPGGHVRISASLNLQLSFREPLLLQRPQDSRLEHVLIVNLDARDFDVQVGDESTILPRRLSQGLEKALKTCLRDSEVTEARDVEDELSVDCEVTNNNISEAFIHYFVELMGHYLNHFQPSPEGNMVFDREGFIKSTNSKSMKRFLEVFTETQMFSLFIQEKEADSEEGLKQSLFDQRIQTYDTEKRNSKLLGVVNVKKLGQKLAGTAKGVKVKVK